MPPETMAGTAAAKSATDATLPYAEQHLSDFEKRFCYDRFWAEGGAAPNTRYLCSGHALIVVGGAALGTVLGFFGVAILAELLQGPGGEPAGRAFGQYIGGLVCGAPLGAITGLVGSIVFFLRTQYRSGTWSAIVWGGMLLGLLAGALVSFTWGLVGEFGWIGRTLFLLAGSTAGGILASIGATIYESTTKSR